MGLPAAGKTTLAVGLQRHLIDVHDLDCALLDADIERAGGVLQGLGWSAQDRRATVEALAAATTRSPVSIVAYVTPTAAEQDLAAKRVPGLRLIHVDAPITICRRRDLTRDSRAYRDHPALDAPELYCTSPARPDLRLDTTRSPGACHGQLASYATWVLDLGGAP